MTVRNLSPVTLNIFTYLIDSPVCKQSLSAVMNLSPMWMLSSPHLGSNTLRSLLEVAPLIFLGLWLPRLPPPPAQTPFLPSLALTPHARPPPQGCPSYPAHVLMPLLRSHSHRDALLSLPTDGSSFFFQLSCSFMTVPYKINENKRGNEMCME